MKQKAKLCKYNIYKQVTDEEGKTKLVYKSTTSKAYPWSMMQAWIKDNPGHVAKRGEVHTNKEETVETKATTGTVIKAVEHKLEVLNKAEANKEKPVAKKAAFYVPVKMHATCVPADMKRSEAKVRSTLLAHCAHIMKNRKPDVKPPMVDMAYADGTPYQLPITPICGAQIWKNIENHPTMGAQQIADSIAEMATTIRAGGNYIIGKVEDLLLYIPHKYNMFNDNYLEMTDRLKAGTLLLSDRTMAINEMECAFTDGLSGYTATTDGGTFVMIEYLNSVLPKEMIPLTGNAVDYCLGVRILSKDSHTHTELGKSNVRAMTRKRFCDMFKKATGREWTADDAPIMIPKVTMKNYRGEGRRLMVFQWLRGVYLTKKTFTYERVSIGEHISSEYTKASAKIVSDSMVEKADEITKALETADGTAALFTQLKPDAIEEMTIGEDNSYASMVLKDVATNGADWVKAGLPIHKIVKDLIPFFIKRLTGALCYRDRVITLTLMPHMNEVDDKYDIALPSSITRPLSMMGNEPKMLKQNAMVTENRYTIYLEDLALKNGGITIKRTPVVNGKYTIPYERIKWVNDIDGAMTSKALTYLLGADTDGDFIKVSYDVPVEYVNLNERANELQQSTEHLTELMDTIAADDEKIPTWNGKADVAATIKAITKETEAKYPHAGISYLLRGMFAATLVGPNTNASNDCIIQNLTHIDGDYAFIGALGRIMSEGPIHLVKHPDTVVPFDGESLRKHFGKIMRAALNLDVGDDHIRTGTLIWERIARNGIKMEYVRVPRGTALMDASIDENFKMLRRAVNEVEEAEMYGYPIQTVPLSAAMQLIYLKMYEIIPVWAVHPIYQAALGHISVGIPNWGLARDIEFDTKVLTALPLIVNAEKAQTSYYNRHLSVFFSLFSDTHRINWDKNNAAGNIAYRYFNTSRGGNRTVVAEGRLIRPLLAVYLIISSMYQDAVGMNTPHILSDGFSIAELSAARYLIENITS